MTLSSSLAAATSPPGTSNGGPPPDPAPNIAPRQPKEVNKTSKRFTSNISVEFKNGTSTSSTRDRITTLFAVMLQADPTIQLHPFDPPANLPVLSSTAEVPPSDITGYVSKGKTLKFGVKHHIQMSANLRLSAIKNHKGVMSHLSKHHIWLRPHSIRSHDIANVGFVFRKNCEAHSRHEIYDEMVAALGGKFTEFQLVPRFPFYKEGIITKAWMVQMDKDDSNQWLPIMLRTFRLQTAEIGIQLVPFSNAATDHDKSVLKVYLFQNKWLHEQTVIRVDNLRGINAPLIETAHPNDSSTIRKAFTALTDEHGTQLFLSVSQYNSGRVTFLCKNAQYQDAAAAVDELIDNYIDNQLTPESRAAITFPNRVPIRIGRPKIPEFVEPTIAEIRELYLPDFEIDINNDDAVSVWSNHRAGASTYASVASVAATATSSIDSNPTPDKTVPTPTPTLPAKRPIDSKILTQQDEIDKLLTSIQNQNTALESAQESLEQSVSKLQESTATTLQEVQRINQVTTRINATLAAHSTQMQTQQNLLSQLLAGMNEIRTSLTTDPSSPPRKMSRLTTDTVTMDGIVPDTTAQELSQALLSQARFLAPPPATHLPCPSIPEEPNPDPEDASDSEENLYSSHPYSSPQSSPTKPPDPRNQRQTE